LRGVADMERVLSRIALRSARPRDLTALRSALAAMPALRQLLAGLSSPLLAALRADCSDHLAEHALLERAVAVEPAALLRDGGVIAAGYDAELDELRRIASDTDAWLLEIANNVNSSAPASPTSSSASTACRVSISSCRARRPTRRRPSTSAGRP
jgi:DNA mismatch repair protein MutS